MSTAERILGQIRKIRERTGMNAAEAAERASMNDGYWRHVERFSRPAVSVEVVARMAGALGYRLDLVPIGSPPPVMRRSRVQHALSPTARRIMDRIKATREAAGLSQGQAGARAGLTTSTWGNLERGHHQGYSVGIDRIDAAARAVGLQLEAVDEARAALLELDPDELYALLRAAGWYRRRAERVPVVLESAIRKLTAVLAPKDTESTERNAA